jgi:hypothetical protein
MLETLEDRRLLAVVIWNGEGGNSEWENPNNWEGKVAPQADDSVIIREVDPGQINNVTVNLAQTVKELTIQQNYTEAWVKEGKPVDR